MGLRTMVSPTRGGQAPHFPPVARQGSLYNLTLEEVQNQLGDLGKPLNSMNLDELLKSVIAVEENDHHHHHLSSHSTNASSSSSSSTSPLLPANLNLNQTVSRSTVDEVWSEIVVQHEQDNVGAAAAGGDASAVQRQPTLGEMTLEDFLIRAGAINHDLITINSQHLLVADPNPEMEWLPYHQVQIAAAAAHQHQQMAVLGSGLPVAPPVFGNSSADAGYSENHQLALTMPLPLVGAGATSLSDSHAAAAAERKRQFSHELMEKTIERRQKRMIKNRESAARSRARKQAYTNQLEQEVSNLRKTNWRLKKQKEMEMLLPLNQSSEPKYQLRRTSTAPF